jgi:hypothetical protein
MQSSWDLRQLTWSPPGFIYYFFFLLSVWVASGAKIYEIRRATKRIERDRGTGNFGATTYNELRVSVSILLRWAGLTFLGWSLFLSISIGDLRFNTVKEKIDAADIPVFVRGYAATLTMALITIIVLYLFQWSLWKKIETLTRDVNDPSRTKK